MVSQLKRARRELLQSRRLLPARQRFARASFEAEIAKAQLRLLPSRQRRFTRRAAQALSEACYDYVLRFSNDVSFVMAASDKPGGAISVTWPVKMIVGAPDEPVATRHSTRIADTLVLPVGTPPEKLTLDAGAVSVVATAAASVNCPAVTLDGSALHALHVVVENYLTVLFADAALCAATARHVTVGAEFTAARHLRRWSSPHLQ